MDYIDVRWNHELRLEPVRLVFELDGSRMETRKLEFFRDGTVGRAWSGGSSFGTALSIGPVPTIDEINGDAQFRAMAIQEAEFERLWSLSPA